MEDDLNTPNAYAVLFDTVKKVNQTLRTREKDLEAIACLRKSLRRCLQILGIETEVVALSEEERELFRSWNAAKAEKDFARADGYRAALQEKGLL